VEQPQIPGTATNSQMIYVHPNPDGTYYYYNNNENGNNNNNENAPEMMNFNPNNSISSTIQTNFDDDLTPRSDEILQRQQQNRSRSNSPSKPSMSPSTHHTSSTPQGLPTPTTNNSTTYQMNYNTSTGIPMLKIQQPPSSVNIQLPRSRSNSPKHYSSAYRIQPPMCYSKKTWKEMFFSNDVNTSQSAPKFPKIIDANYPINNIHGSFDHYLTDNHGRRNHHPHRNHHSAPANRNKSPKNNHSNSSNNNRLGDLLSHQALQSTKHLLTASKSGDQSDLTQSRSRDPYDNGNNYYYPQNDMQNISYSYDN
jgi:hypothetical protein